MFCRRTQFLCQKHTIDSEGSKIVDLLGNIVLEGQDRVEGILKTSMLNLSTDI